jgi:hypothetical protein
MTSLYKGSFVLFIFIQLKTLTSKGGKMNAVLFPVQPVFKGSLNEEE